MRVYGGRVTREYVMEVVFWEIYIGGGSGECIEENVYGRGYTEEV